MKKIILYISISIFSIISQDLLAQKHVYFRAGYNSSTIASTGFKPWFGQNRTVRSTYEPGFLISTGLDFHLTHSLSLGTELNYLRETGGIYHSGHEIGSIRILSMNEKWSSHQLQFPLLLKWEQQLYPLLFGVYAGPALSVLLSGDRTNSAGRVYNYVLQEDVPNPKDYYLFKEKQQDISLVVGVDFAFQTEKGDFLLEGRMTRGFVNFDQQKTFSFHQQSFAILAGYRINLAPKRGIEL